MKVQVGNKSTMRYYQIYHNRHKAQTLSKHCNSRTEHKFLSVEYLDKREYFYLITAQNLNLYGLLMLLCLYPRLNLRWKHV
jgi:hypothetical protein